MGTKLCESPSSALGYGGTTVHHFLLLRTKDRCSLLPLRSSPAEWEEETSLPVLSTSIQQWRTKLPLSESVSLDTPLVTRRVCSLQQCSAAWWLALLNNGDKSSLSCQSSIRPPLHSRAGRAAAVLWGWRLSPKDARLLLCHVYKASGFYATSGSAGSCQYHKTSSSFTWEEAKHLSWKINSVRVPKLLRRGRSDSVVPPAWRARAWDGAEGWLLSSELFLVKKYLVFAIPMLQTMLGVSGCPRTRLLKLIAWHRKRSLVSYLAATPSHGFLLCSGDASTSLAPPDASTSRECMCWQLELAQAITLLGFLSGLTSSEQVN